MSLRPRTRPTRWLVALTATAGHVLLTSAPASPLAADATATSLVRRNSTPATPWTLDLGGHTLNLISGGLLTSAGTSITNGQISAGGNSPAPAELFVRSSLAADIVDNPAGAPVSVIISAESGAISLTGHNTYSGATILNAGTLTVSSTTLPAATTLQINGGLLNVAGKANITVGSLSIRDQGSIRSGLNATLQAGAYNLESGWIETVALTGAAALTKTSPDEARIIGHSPNFSGPVTVNGGDLLAEFSRASTDQPLGTGPITVSGGRLVLWNGTSVSNPITLAGGALAGYGPRSDGPIFFGAFFDGPVDVTADAALVTTDECTLTLRGTLNIAPGRTLTKSGVMPLYISGPVAAAPGSTLRVRSGNLGMNSPGHDALNLRADNSSVTFFVSTRLAALDLHHASAQLTAGNRTLALHSLTLADASTLDLTDGALILDYATGVPSPTAQLRADLAANRLTSSLKSATRALGYAEAADVLTFTDGTATFLNQPLDPTTLLVRLTVPGDANLDGVVNFADLLALARHYNATADAATWSAGDFTYDNAVNFADLLLLARNYNAALPATPLPGAPASFNTDLAAAVAATVPEPITLAALAACGFALTARRRRKRLEDARTLPFSDSCRTTPC